MELEWSRGKQSVIRASGWPGAIVPVTLDVTRPKTNLKMIRSFKDRDAQALFEGGSVRRLRTIERQAQRRLQILDSAEGLLDLSQLPSNRFESLKGDRKGQYSIRINDQWRLCFRWNDANEAIDVEIVDYH